MPTRPPQSIITTGYLAAGAKPEIPKSAGDAIVVALHEVAECLDRLGRGLEHVHRGQYLSAQAVLESVHTNDGPELDRWLWLKRLREQHLHEQAALAAVRLAAMRPDAGGMN